MPCLLGAVKSNIGHLEAAAGVAGLIKTLLALRHEAMPPNLHFQELNSHISLDNTRFIIPTTLCAWPASAERRYAAVSSFGFGGTNAHVVVEEAPQLPEVRQVVDEKPGRLYLLPLSGHSPMALRSLADAYREYLAAADGQPSVALRDICYTASVRRTHYDQRLAVVGDCHRTMAEQLQSFLQGENRRGVASGRRVVGRQTNIAFVFSGQGAQWRGMGRDLLQEEPVFRTAIERCDQLLRQYAPWSLLAGLMADDSGLSLEQTEVAQPVILAVQVALAELWRSWGVTPAAVVGHSLGEIAAACIAGVMSLEDAIRTAYHRGRLMERASGLGGMLSIEMPVAQVEGALDAFGDRLSVAAINSPQSTVVSGDLFALEELMRSLRQRGVSCSRLRGDYAFHSPHMEPLRDELVQALQGVDRRQAVTPIFSTVTGLPASTTDYGAAYWGRNIRQPVLFASALERVLEHGCNAFVEIGPHPVLFTAISQCLGDAVSEGCVVTSLRRGQAGRMTMLWALGSIYAQGYPVKWELLYPTRGRCTPLPAIRWQRERCWLAPSRRTTPGPAQSQPGAEGTSHDPLLGRLLRSPALKGTVFEARLTTTELPFLVDHRVHGTAVLPAAAYVDIALAATSRVSGAGPCLVEDLKVLEAFFLPEGEPQTLQTILTGVGNGELTLEIYSPFLTDEVAISRSPSSAWKLHVTGRICPSDSNVETTCEGSLAAAQARCEKEVDTSAYYERLQANGLRFGPSFRAIDKLWCQHGEALGCVRLPAALTSEAEAYHIHPALLDACLQTLGATFLLDQREGGGGLYLPVGIERFHLRRRPGLCVWAHARLRGSFDVKEETLTGDVWLFDDTGQALAEMEGVQLKRVSRERLAQVPQADGAAPNDDRSYEITWQPQTLVAKEAAASPIQTGKWLILADSEGLGLSLARGLRARGATCVLAFPGRALEIAPDGGWLLDPTRPDEFERLLHAGLGPEGGSWQAVVHLWGMESPPPGTDMGDRLRAALVMSCASALHLAQALGKITQAPRPRLWFVSRGAQRVGTESTPVAVAQAPVWGLQRTLVLENPDLKCACLDLDPSVGAANAEALLAELLSGSEEDQVAFRDGGRYVARLVRRQVGRESARRTPDHQPVRLDSSQRGTLDNLELSPAVRRQPGPGEVEIRVRATGVNFRDVLNALGMDPGGQAPFGGECAGAVVGVGPGVQGLRLGEEVVALARDCFSTYATTRANLLVTKPPEITFEQAAALPIAFLTAYYGLHHLAKLDLGEKVLIHAAAGGVGLAAVQLALRTGATVFATAGSEEKRAYLRSLGVKHVADSRSLDFADYVLARTDGQGVDVVLNSLAGEFIPRSLSVLKPEGRFLEIGKRGIWSPSEVERMLPRAKYFAYDLGEIMEREPDLIRADLQTLVAEVARGSLTPLSARVFPLERAVDAFRYMAQARHIGKIVVSQPGLTAGPGSAQLVRPDATYVVTGGFGGLGLVVARWLANNGAVNLVLLGRSALSRSARETIGELERKGVHVLAAQADVSKEDDLAGVLKNVAESMPPIRGIIHAAGVLDDGVLSQQDWSRFLKVMAPKVEGGWLLHQLSRGMPLDFFALFSSAAAVLGSPGQANYVAANAFLDALAHHRRALGLKALSVNWGRWGQGGMAAGLHESERKRWTEQGVRVLSPERGIRALEDLLRQDLAQAVVMPIDWSQYLRHFPPDRQPPILSELAREVQLPAVDAHPAPVPDLLRRLAESPPNRRPALLTTHIREQALRVLGLSPAQSIDPRQPLHELGLDSLMAVELRNALGASVRRPLPTTLLFDYPTIEALVEYMMRELLPGNPLEAEVQPKGTLAPKWGEDVRAVEVAQLAHLSDDEAEALLLRELAETKRERK